MPKRVIIIEDNVPLKDAFVEIVNAEDGFKVVDSYTQCEEAISYLDQDRPDIVLMDIELPGMNGVEGTRIIKAKYPQTAIIVVTVYDHSKIVFDALCAGAIGYLTKNVNPDYLVEALHEAVQGGAPMSIRIAKMVVDSFRKATHSILSDRETDVLRLLASGSSYRSIGEQLFISRNTIKYHIKNIYEKLQVHTREEAIRKANREKLI